MRGAALCLALLVGATARADGPRVVLEVRSGRLTTSDGREAEVTGGAYLDRDTLIAVAKETAALRAENKALREAPVVTPAMIVVGVVLGVAAGFAAAKLSSR